MIFLAELILLSTWTTDIGNAYLEAKTKQKVYIVAAPPKTSELENHLFIINKALYGLRSSGLRWHEKLANILRNIGFVPSKGENDILMQRNGEVYEYIAFYVDDLCIVAKDPKNHRLAAKQVWIQTQGYRSNQLSSWV